MGGCPSPLGIAVDGLVEQQLPHLYRISDLGEAS